MGANNGSLPVIVVGGGIGGLASALALAREGVRVKILEQAPAIGEIGAGVQLAPNAFAALDALGVGERARAHAVYSDRIVMLDATDEYEVGSIPVGAAFEKRFGNPYAVIHRADIHQTLLEGVRALDQIELVTSARVERIETDGSGVLVVDSQQQAHRGAAVVGCDGVRSVIREQLVGDPLRVSGHVVYRAVVDAKEFPADLQWNAAVVWVGPNYHLVHYPLRHKEQYNLVVTFHSAKQETFSVTEGSQEEVIANFSVITDRPRQLLTLPKSWKRWATADREPIARWSYGRATLLGDAAHPMLQYLAQGACMAMEDAVTLGKAVGAAKGDFAEAFVTYERSRIARTARVVLSAREMGRIYHAKGVERLVRNDLWRGRTPERFYDAVEWLFGWNAEHCLAH